MRSREVEMGHFKLDFATHVLRSSASLLLAKLEVNSGSERRTISEVVAAPRFGRSVAQCLGCCGYTIGSIFLYRIFAKSAASGSYQRKLKCELKSIFCAMACRSSLKTSNSAQVYINSLRFPVRSPVIGCGGRRAARAPLPPVHLTRYQ